MAPTLRKSTQDKMQVSADTASEDGFVRKPRAPVTRRQRYARNKGLVSMKTPKNLQHITFANVNSPLLRLPPEIRNIVFEYVLTWRYDIELYYNRVSGISLSGYSTCVSRTAAKILGLRLPQNVFSLATKKGMNAWLKKCLPAQREAIERLELLNRNEEDRDRICKKLCETSCPNLRSLDWNEEAAGIVWNVRLRYMDWGRECISTNDEEAWEKFEDFKW